MSKRPPSPSSLGRREKKLYEDFLESSSTETCQSQPNVQSLAVRTSKASQLNVGVGVGAAIPTAVGVGHLSSTFISVASSQPNPIEIPPNASAQVITHSETDIVPNVEVMENVTGHLPPTCGNLSQISKRISRIELDQPKNLDKEYRVRLEEEEGHLDIFCCPDVGNVDTPSVGSTQAIGQPTDLLYAGSAITVTESITAILAFAQSEDISGAGLGKLLNLIDIYLPQPNKSLKTTHSFYKQLESVDGRFTLDYYCSVCWKPRSSLQDRCDTCVDPTRKVEYFASLPLGPQIAKLFARPGFVEKLKYKNKRTKKMIPI